MIDWPIETAARKDQGHADDVRSTGPRAEEIALSQAISLKRIADSLERIGDCADGIHPSAFRVIKQEG